MSWPFKALVLFAAFILASHTRAQESQFSKIPIPAQCTDGYQQGYDLFITSLSKRISVLERENFYLEAQKKVIEDCQFSFLLGLFDGQNIFLQRLVLEFGLEIDQALQSGGDDREQTIDDLTRYFKYRVDLAGLDPEIIGRIDIHSAEFNEMLVSFKEKMSKVAQDLGMAVPFERFVFVSGGRIEPYTSAEYVRDEDGKISFDQDGATVTVKTGTWQQAGNRIFQAAVDLGQEYLAWRPAMLWGEDSFVSSSLNSDVNYEKTSFFGFLGGKLEKWTTTAAQFYGISDKNAVAEKESLREIKESYYFNTMAKYISEAKKIDLNVTSLVKMQKQMIDQQRSILDRNITIIKGAIIGTFLAPFVPIAMHAMGKGIGAVASYTVSGEVVATAFGLADGALMSSAVSFKLVGGSFGLAANISAATALSPLIYFGYKGLSAYEEQRKIDNAQFSLSNAYDYVLSATINAVPLSVILPASLGAALFTGKTAVLSVEWLLRGGTQVIGQIGEVGLKHFFGSIPGSVARAWLSGWRKQPILIVTMILDVAMGAYFEISTREFMAHHKWAKESSRFYLKQEDGSTKWNEDAMFSLYSSAALNVILRPIWTIKHLGGRFVVERFTASIIGAIISLKDHSKGWKRVEFDQMYFSVTGNITREMERGLTIDAAVQNSSGVKRLGLLGLNMIIKWSLSLAKTPLKNMLMDAYMKDDSSMYEQIKEHFETNYGIDMREYTDEEFKITFDRIREEVLNHSFTLPAKE